MPVAPPLAGVTAVARATTSAPAQPTPPSGPSFGALLEARSARLAPPVPPASADRLPAAVARGIEGIERAQARLDGVLAAARSGRTFTAQELLSLQGEAYRYSQTVELTAKLVEQGAQAVKQALHAQV